MMAIEKSLPDETKKILRRNLVKSDKNVVGITLFYFFQTNLIKNVGTNLKTGVSFCLFWANWENLFAV